MSWTDHCGRVWKVPTAKKLHFACRSHQALREFVIHRDGLKCYLCGDAGRPIKDIYDRVSWRLGFRHSLVTIDHLVPISRGGTHHPDNLRVACSECNSIKGSRLLSEGVYV